MAKCEACNLEMRDPDSVSCLLPILIVAEPNGFIVERYWRNSSYFDINDRCHDCNIVNAAGNYHHWGCDIERCPKCGQQLISCDCFHGMSLKLTADVNHGGPMEDIKKPIKGRAEMDAEKEKTIRENPKHLKCEHCGHEEDIFAACAIPAEGGGYTLYFGSDADFCTNCDKPWGRNVEG